MELEILNQMLSELTAKSLSGFESHSALERNASDQASVRRAIYLLKEKEARYKQVFSKFTKDSEIEKIANAEFLNVGDQALFPNHSDKDIWSSGFKDGFKWILAQHEMNKGTSGEGLSHG